MRTEGLKKSIRQASTHPIVSCYPDTPLAELLFALEEHNFVLVVGKGDGHLVGLLTRQDVVKAYLEDPEWKYKLASAIMTPREKLLWLPNSVSLLEAIKPMAKKGVHQLVISGPAEGGHHPVAVLTLADVIRELRSDIDK